jgi:hypothetical protein
MTVHRHDETQSIAQRVFGLELPVGMEMVELERNTRSSSTLSLFRRFSHGV